MKMPIPQHEIGALVYLRADVDHSGIVTGYVVRAGGAIQYLVSLASDEAERCMYDFELLDEKPYGALGET